VAKKLGIWRKPVAAAWRNIEMAKKLSGGEEEEESTENESASGEMAKYSMKLMT
jgi:hypothetical protein